MKKELLKEIKENIGINAMMDKKIVISYPDNINGMYSCDKIVDDDLEGDDEDIKKAK